MNKIFLEFETNFWGNVAALNIAHDERGKNPFFINLYPYTKK